MGLVLSNISSAANNVDLGDIVDPAIPVARFMNKSELNKYGWQFDHLHFEIMIIPPKPLEPNQDQPAYFFGTYCLEFNTQAELMTRYANSEVFFKNQWQK